MRKAIAVLVLAVAACSTPSLTATGAAVRVRASVPSTDCDNLGTVTGQGGGMFGGVYISNDSLIEYAMNDARNKAAALGATDIQFQAPQLGGGNGTTTTATVITVAHKCKSP